MVGVDTIVVFGVALPNCKFMDVVTILYKHFEKKGVDFSQNMDLSDFLNYAKTHLTHYKLKGKTMTNCVIKFPNTDIKLCKFFYKKEYFFLTLLTPLNIVNSGITSIEFATMSASLQHNEANDILDINKSINKNINCDFELFVLNKMYI